MTTNEKQSEQDQEETEETKIWGISLDRETSPPAQLSEKFLQASQAPRPEDYGSALLRPTEKMLTLFMLSLLLLFNACSMVSMA